MRHPIYVATFLAAILTLFLPSQLLCESEGELANEARTVLETNCTACHGEAAMSGLDLRQRQTILKGGDRGPAVIPGKPDESLLYLAASHSGELKMPPQKPRLEPEDLAVLEKWIQAGATWKTPSLTEEEKRAASWWSFQRPKRPSTPKVEETSWVRNPIDAFVLAQLEKKGLGHAPPAGRRTLLRRAYFDLIGLPPSPQEVTAFLNDPSPDAYKKLIDKLLDSEHYGERWGRHWLDVVRYADSGGFETDKYFPVAWRYRDYVIKSFNEDKPYDRFLQEQIAADELWTDDLDLRGSFAIPEEKLRNLEARVGTGLYTLAPQTGESKMDFRRDLYENLTDWVDTTGSAFLGLTFGCARCHDHKFDPLTQRDYFRLQAVFASSKVIEIPVVTKLSLFHRSEYYKTLLNLAERRVAYRIFEKQVTERVIADKKGEFPPHVVEAYEDFESVYIDGEGRFAQRWTPEKEKLARPLIEAIESILIEGTTDRLKNVEEHLKPEEEKKYRELLAQMGKAVLDVPDQDPSHNIKYDALFDSASVRVLTHREPELVSEIHLLDRGELGREKEKVKPGLPAVLDDGRNLEEALYESVVPRSRTQLALWLTRPDHPLTSRVMVNRIWQWHFGAGVVRTPNDFGRMGVYPTHPELLDWLATKFVDRGWSIKSMHRLIMLSNTYQMTSRYSDKNSARIDPENRYLWRMNRRRLEAETAWDAVHAVAGTLNLKMGGRPVCPPLPEGELKGKNWYLHGDPADYRRRAVYIMRQRNFGFPMFETFDVPDPAVSCPGREETTVAPQALWFLNNKVVFDQARQFASRLVQDVGTDPLDWVESAWQVALGRPPSEPERREALELLQSLPENELKEDTAQTSGEMAEAVSEPPGALSQLCLALLNLNEFLYVD